MATYTRVNDNLYYTTIPASAFNILFLDKEKNTTTINNYFNAGFFSGPYTNGHTLPCANMVCNYDGEMTEALNALKGWGASVENGRIYKSNSDASGDGSYKGKSASTLVLDSSNNFSIQKLLTVPSTAKYAISGPPVMKNGADISWISDVKPEGWLDGFPRATWHGLLCLTSNTSQVIYVAMKTSDANCISSGEAFRTLSGMGLGIQNAIMLDGGGSFIFKNSGNTVVSVEEKRRINNIIIY